MSYATQAELIAWCGIDGASELVALTDPVNATIDSALVAKKLDQADAEIDARLPTEIHPISSPYPKALVDTACKIARYLLHTNGRPEHVEADYRSAISFLSDVRAGKASLGLVAGVVQTSERGPVVVASSAVFSDEYVLTMP